MNIKASTSWPATILLIGKDETAVIYDDGKEKIYIITTNSWLRFKPNISVIPTAALTGLEFQTGWVGNTLRIRADGQTHTASNLSRRPSQRLYQALQGRMEDLREERKG